MATQDVRYGTPVKVPPARYRIFLSHSERDRQLVDGIKAQVEAIGISVYLYEDHAEPGRSIPDKLQQAIREHDALVVLFTANSASRAFVHHEVGYAIGQGKPAVALVTPDVPGEALGMLEGEYIRLEPANPAHGMAQLMQYLYSQAAAENEERLRTDERQKREALFQAIALVAVVVLLAYAFAQLEVKG